MPDSCDAGRSDVERRVLEVTSTYVALEKTGAAPDRDALLAAHPDLTQELLAFLQDRDTSRQSVADKGTDPPTAGEVTAGIDSSSQADVTTEGAGDGRVFRATNEDTAGTKTSGAESGLSTANDDDGAISLKDVMKLEASERRFGDYELLCELGRGGMGVVYKARQVSLNRLVAVKMLQSRLLATADDLKRFQNEAEAIAMLDHPHIVPILEVGQWRDGRFYSMKLIDGSSLDKRLDEFRSDPTAVARLMATIARAVHHAHERGVLHRDLKPANVLLDEDRQPFVTDFGLAKRVEADSELTQSGAIMGTPAYMAPEQATGRRREVTRATDVYGLGAILYALLTGRPPFRADSVMEILQAVRDQAPEAPSKMNSLVPRDLQVICLKCLEKEPSRRYQGADEVANDLVLFLAGESISARPAGKLERSWRWCRRNATVVGFSATILLLLVGIGIVAGILGGRVARRPNDSPGPLNLKSRAEGAAREAAGAVARGRIVVQVPDDARNTTISRGGDETTVAGRGAHELLRPAGRYQVRMSGGGPERTDVVEIVAEKRLEVGNRPRQGTLNAARDELETLFYQPQLVLTTGGHDAPVRAMLFSANGEHLYSAGDDKVVNVWRMRDKVPTIERTLRPPVWRGPRGRIFAMALSPKPDADGQSFLAVAGYGIESSGGDITIFRVPGLGRNLAGEVVKRLERPRGVAADSRAIAHTNTILCMAFDHDGGVLASGSNDATVILWDTRAGFEPIRQLKRGNARILSLSFSPDGKHLATGDATGDVVVWDVAKGEAVEAIGSRVLLNVVTYSPDGRLIVAGCENGSLVRMDSAKLSGPGLSSMRRADGRPILGAAFHPGGRLLAVSVKSDASPMLDPATISFDIELRELPSGEVVKRWPNVAGLVRALAFSPDGERLAYSGGVAQAVMIQDTSKRDEPPVERKGAGTTLFDLGFTEDSSTIGFTRERHRSGEVARLYEGFDLVRHRSRSVRGDKLRHAATAYQGWTLALDQKTAGIAAVHRDGRIRQFKLQAGMDGLPWSFTVVPPAPGHLSATVAVGADAGVVVFDFETGRRTRMFAGHSGPVVSVVSSPDGRWLASSSFDQVIMLYALAGCDRRPALGARLRQQADSSWVIHEIEPASFAEAIGLQAGDVVLEAAIGMEMYARTGRIERFSADADEVAPGLQMIGLRVRRLLMLPILNAIPVTKLIPCTKRDNALLTLFPGIDKEWVLWTRQGYYDSSAVADQKYLGWHRNGGAGHSSSEFSPAIAFEAQFRRPGVLSELWSADEPTRYSAMLERVVPGGELEPRRLRVLTVGPIESDGAERLPAPESARRDASDVAERFVRLGRRLGFDQVDARFLGGESASGARIDGAFTEMEAEGSGRRPRPGDAVIVFLAARVDEGKRGLRLVSARSEDPRAGETGASASELGGHLKGLAQRGYQVAVFVNLIPVATDDRLASALTEWERDLFLGGVVVFAASRDRAGAWVDGSGRGALAAALGNVLETAAKGGGHEGPSSASWTVERFSEGLEREVHRLTGGLEGAKGYFVESASAAPFLNPNAVEKRLPPDRSR